MGIYLNMGNVGFRSKGWRLRAHILWLLGEMSLPVAMAKASEATGKKFKGYWTRTGTFESLRVYIDMNFDGLKEAVLQMLGGARCSMDADMLFQNDMTSIFSEL